MSIKIGDRFGNLEVTEYLGRKEHNGRHRPLFSVTCDCGHNYQILGNELKKGKLTRKGCLKCKGTRLRCVSAGEKYDKLTVLRYDEESRLKHKRIKVICLCDCGNTITIRPELLRINVTNNCGCAPRGLYKGYKDISGIFLYRLKSNAKVRGLEYSITPEYLWELFEQQNKQCALTKQPLTFKPKTASVDRIDSSKGYVKGNIQWVHKRINIMKGTMSNAEFINICKMVSNFY